MKYENRINSIKRFNELDKTNEEINWIGKEDNYDPKPNGTPSATRSRGVYQPNNSPDRNNPPTDVEDLLNEQEKELLLKAIDHYENFKHLKFYNLEIVDSIKSKLNL